MKDVVQYAKVSAIMQREWDRINAIIVRAQEDQRYAELDRALYAREILHNLWISLGSEVEVCVDGVHGKQAQVPGEVRPAPWTSERGAHRQYTERDEPGRIVFTAQ